MVMSAVSTNSYRVALGTSPARSGLTLLDAQPLPPADEDEFAMVRRPICSMNAWLSTGGVVPAE